MNGKLLAAPLLVVALLAPHAPAKTVVIVKSKALDAYEAPVRSLRESLRELRLEELELGTRDDDEVMTRVAALRPDLVVALGGRALHQATRRLPGVPVVFSMVLDPQKHLAAGAMENVAGVSLDVPVEAVLTQLQMAVGGARRIGVLFHPESTGPRVEEARKRARAMGLEVVPVAVKEAAEVERRFIEAAAGFDALWMIPDPVVYTKDSYRALVRRTQERKMPFCAFSRAFVAAGALLGVSPSYESIGSQLGLLVRRVLVDGAKPAELGVAPPIGSELVVNLEAARTIGLRIPSDVLDAADEVIGQ